jgi:hypothetical protein
MMRTNPLGHGSDNLVCPEMIYDVEITVMSEHLAKHQKATNRWIEITDPSSSYSSLYLPMSNVRSLTKFSIKLVNS